MEKKVYGSKIRKPRSDFPAVSTSIVHFSSFFSSLPELCDSQNVYREETPFFAKVFYASYNIRPSQCLYRSVHRIVQQKKKLPATTNAHSLSAHYVRDSKTLARRCRSRRWRRWLRCRCSRRSGHFLVTFPVAFPFSVLLHLTFSLTLALLELQQHPGGTRRTDSSSVGGQDERWWRREGGRWILGDGMRGGRAAGHRRRLRCRQQVSSDLKLGSLR